MRHPNLKKTCYTDMQELTASIWSDVDRLLNKPTLKKSINIHICNLCNGQKVVTPSGVPTCTECGVVDVHYIDDTAEWKSSVDERGRVDDPARCGAPNANPELFSDQWGKGTVIATKFTSTYEDKRMAKINFHQSMNYKDRSLFHAYKDIEEACLNIPGSVLQDAKFMYRKFNVEKLTRGAVRTGIKANCVLYACRLSKIPRTTKEIAEMFNIQSKDISRTTQLFKDTILGTTSKNYITKPQNVLQRLLNSFEVSRDERFKCNQMCNKLEKCAELMSKTPTTVAAVVIYIVLKSKIPKPTVAERCSVSIPTINKIENIIVRYLEK